MTGTVENLALAIACFVGGHFVLSSIQVRRLLVRMIGEASYRGAYSILALMTLIWTIVAYRAAPREAIWVAGAGLRFIPFLLMPIACILAVAAFSTRSVTLAGGEEFADSQEAMSGIMTITRHPFLWAVVLWSLGHIAANGDAASIVLFSGMMVLAFGGMIHIDHRRRVTLGGAWGPIALTTSTIPFLAAAQRRTKVDWTGIGWVRGGVGLALACVLAIAHGWATGVDLFPGLLSANP